MLTEAEKVILKNIRAMGIGRTTNPDGERKLIMKALDHLEKCEVEEEPKK